jgi:(S)-2-hydroxyglutarate dehydrogenase
VSGQVDVLVVGGGILGLASAREILLRHPALRLCVLEKEDSLATHQTGHNSGVIHSGIYYAPGSLKARLCVEGSRLLYDYCDEHEVPYERCGKVIVATRDEELPRLDELYRRGKANGVPGLRELDRSELARLEPHVAGVRALHSPATGIVDFKRVAASFAEDVISLGGAIWTGTEVHGIVLRSRGANVSTGSGEFEARYVITCGGLQSDRLARMTGGPESPKIVPFRGSYYVLRHEARSLVNGLVYPVPDPAFPFLGVHFTKQISGDVWAGPNAVLAFAREGYRPSDFAASELLETLRYRGFYALARKHWRAGIAETWVEFRKAAFVRALRRLVPQVTEGDLGERRAGVRAQALSEQGILVDDFWLDQAPGVTHVRNAPSPAATSSLAIARHIAQESEQAFGLG